MSRAGGTHLLTVAVALTGLTIGTSSCWLFGVQLPRPGARVEPTPFVPTSWELRRIILPAGHTDGVVMNTSPDGKVIVFRDPNVYDPLFLEVGGEARTLVPPGHVQGAPIGSQMFPDGRRLLVRELAHAWLYDIATGTSELVPDPPDGGSGTYILTDGRIVALTGSVASHEFGGVTNSKVWLLDPTTMAWSELGSRHDGIAMLPMSDGVALITDRSPDHDNSQWAWYRIGFDGSESLIHQFDGPAGSVTLAPDGSRVAVSRTVDGVSGAWLLDVATGDELRVSDGFPVSFSPDGLQLAIYFSDGHREAITLDGRSVASIGSGQVGWIGVS